MSAPGRRDDFPIGGGAFVAVVGPSGAGKDSVMAYARERLSSEPAVHFVRRVITRPCDPSLEDHDTTSPAAFAAAEAEGAFALSWSSHGLSYGIPVMVDELVRSGAVAVANLSRAALPDLRSRYANAIIAEITASPEVLARRLALRGRETAEEIAARLTRTVTEERRTAPRHVIDNSGPLAEAGERFVDLVRAHIPASADT
jgi:ribose 1,5-bisphosphokinase